jgi:hypothetical protein
MIGIGNGIVYSLLLGMDLSAKSKQHKWLLLVYPVAFNPFFIPICGYLF